ncbi:MarR family transcriptional regulator [Deltaproteobacteria bacterium OttesenSCG-928-K17]|nr:MarR family transcriptional regulator [Deltaproteobacteria bacterium OttesenSCG-928-K17]
MGYPGNDAANVIAELRNKINNFILSRLSDAGITGLTLSHGAIFTSIYLYGPQTMQSLSKNINRNKSTVTILTRKLESRGYVRREKDMLDKRSSIIHLTEKGFRFREVFDQISNELVDRLWGDKSPRERRRFEDELKSMLERL